jgi:catechol 2,3-dioxygenase-like lactoylglutathione lyase family enzyme
MLKSQPIIAFIATKDPLRAKEFYANALGLHIVGEDGHATSFDAGGTMLRLTTVRTLAPAGYTVLGWIVQNIGWSIRDLMSRGVVFRRYDGFIQDELGIWTSPSGAKIAWFEDPDGNTLSLTEFERPKRKTAGRKSKPSAIAGRSRNTARKTKHNRR